MRKLARFIPSREVVAITSYTILILGALTTAVLFYVYKEQPDFFDRAVRLAGAIDLLILLVEYKLLSLSPERSLTNRLSL